MIDVGEAVRPHGLAWGPDGLLYATAELKQQVLVIDPKARRVVGAIPTGKPQSHMLVVTRDGTHGFTANVDGGTISMLDLKTRTLAKVIQAAEQVQRPDPLGRRPHPLHPRQPQAAGDPHRRAQRRDPRDAWRRRASPSPRRRRRTASRCSSCRCSATRAAPRPWAASIGST